MANVYNERKRAIAEIDALIYDETPIALIIYKITAKYGFSAKIVRERLANLAELRAISPKSEVKNDGN